MLSEDPSQLTAAGILCAVCPPSSSCWLYFNCAVATLACEEEEEGRKGRKQRTEKRDEKAEDTSAALMFCPCDANCCCSETSGHLPALPVCQEDLGSCVKQTSMSPFKEGAVCLFVAARVQAMGREDAEATP